LLFITIDSSAGFLDRVHKLKLKVILHVFRRECERFRSRVESCRDRDRDFSIPSFGVVNGELTLQVASDPRGDLPFGAMNGNDAREGHQRVRFCPDDCVPKSGVVKLGRNNQRLGDAVKMKVRQALLINDMSLIVSVGATHVRRRYCSVNAGKRILRTTDIKNRRYGTDLWPAMSESTPKMIAVAKAFALC